MKILLLCNKPPWPPREGGPMATYALVSGLLSSGHQVKILALNTNKLNTKFGDVPESFRNSTRLELIDIDLSLNPFSALYHLLTGTSYHVSRFDSETFRKRLAEILIQEEFDIVQYEIIHMVAYHDTVKKYSSAKTIIRAHNIEHLIWQRVALGEKRSLKRWYMKQLFLSLRQFELEAINKVNGIAAITEIDAAFFRKNSTKSKVVAVPFGIDVEQLLPVAPFQQPATFFTLGSMNWMPNYEGVLWLLKSVWPVVLKKNPQLKLFIAGRHMPETISEFESDSVRVVGEVPDSVTFINEHSVMLVPLFAGSGIRIKIIEGMSAGRAVISTAVGAEGIQCKHGDNILIADHVEEFSDCILSLADHPERVGEIGANARKLIEKEYNNKLIINKLIGLYQSV